jgi:hypothetical protein
LPQVARHARRGLYLLLAGVFFALAVLGTILPGLPTTPFLLLTSFFLIRSSPSLNAKLLASRRFGPLLENWHRHRAVTRRVKWTALAATTVAVSASALFGNLPPAALAAVLLAGATGIIVVARLPVVGE